ncbi:MAG: glycosyltransferase family 2 protein, partial [Cyanobacteria bacterium J06627_3]
GFMDSLPSVTVAIPTFNEEASIANVLNGFLATTYSGALVIVVADGNSEDGTKKIVSEFVERDHRVRLIDNPLRIQSAALNLILNRYESDIFLRADAHSDYAPDYIERSVEALLETSAMDAGGAQRFVAKTPFQLGVALAAKTFFGSGGAKYRDPHYDGYADTVFLGCFWRQKLLNLGGFSVARNEDGELSLRMVQENPKAIYVSSKIKVWYYPRQTWQRLWRQYVKYGRGRCLTHIRHPDKFHLRSRIPLLFIPGLATLTTITAIVYIFQLGTAAYLACWLIFLYPAFEALRVTLSTRQTVKAEIWRGPAQEVPSVLIRFVYCLMAMITMPLAYNYGYGYQLFQIRVSKQETTVFFE